MKQLVIFDLDGTLLNTIGDLGTAANHTLSVNGYPTHPLESYTLMVGNGVRRLMERALPSESRDIDTVNAVLNDFKKYYDEHLTDLTTVYPGIHELLRALTDAGIAVATASNKYESAVVRLIDTYFPDIPFVAKFGNIDGVMPKPDPSIVFRVLGEHPTSKPQVLYVGDSGVDMETAHRAGVESVGVTWGFRPVHELTTALADHIVSDPAEILALATK